jgi:hypothetical protein
MQSPSSRSSSAPGAAWLGILAALLVSGTSARAFAQACCAGGSVITPGRLAMHEDALVGLQEKAGNVLGSYSQGGQYAPLPAGDTELDFEQDLFAAVRLLRRGQLALLVPLVETRRATPHSLFFAGVGDINLSGRYDFVVAGESHVLPGIAVLAGVTLPTGSTTPAQATGIGAYQINGALALEQIWGPWLVNATGIVAQRTDYGGETLGTQVTLLAAGAYTFDSDAALGLSASYAFEGDATSGGADVPGSFKRVTTVTLSGLWPVSDTWRLQGGLYLNPPVTSFGANQLTVMGLTYTLIRSWS